MIAVMGRVVFVACSWRRLSVVNNTLWLVLWVSTMIPVARVVTYRAVGGV